MLAINASLGNLVTITSLVHTLESCYKVNFEFYFEHDASSASAICEENVLILVTKTGVNGTITVSRYVPKNTLYELNNAMLAAEKLFMDLITEVFNKSCRVKSVIGVKGFNSDWTCRGFKYEVGKTYKLNDLPIICNRGFHFCISPAECITYYGLLNDSKYALVVAKDALIDVSRDKFSAKVASDTIEIVCDITDVYLRCMAYTYGTMSGSSRTAAFAAFHDTLRRAIYEKFPESREYLNHDPCWLSSGLGNTMNAQRMAYKLSPTPMEGATGATALSLNSLAPLA